MFEEVQRRLERDTRTAPGKKEVYLFSGFLQCADCGRSMHRKTSKNHVYYYCRTNQLTKGVCTTRTVRLDALERTVLRALNTQISLVDNLEQIINQINKSPRINNQSDRLSAMLKRQEEERARLTKMTDSLYIDWKNGDITREEYLRMKLKFTVKLDEVRLAIDKIKDDYGVIASLITSENPYFLEFQKHKSVQSLKRDLLVDLIDVILVHENGKLTIRFNFADQYRRIFDFIENN